MGKETVTNSLECSVNALRLLPGLFLIAHYKTSIVRVQLNVRRTFRITVTVFLLWF